MIGRFPQTLASDKQLVSTFDDRTALSIVGSYWSLTPSLGIIPAHNHSIHLLNHLYPPSTSWYPTGTTWHPLIAASHQPVPYGNHTVLHTSWYQLVPVSIVWNPAGTYWYQTVATLYYTESRQAQRGVGCDKSSVPFKLSFDS